MCRLIVVPHSQIAARESVGVHLSRILDVIQPYRPEAAQKRFLANHERGDIIQEEVDHRFLKGLLSYFQSSDVLGYEEHLAKRAGARRIVVALLQVFR